MSVAKKLKHVRVKWMNVKSAETIIHARAQRVLNISGRKFVSKWNSGDYKKMDSNSCPGVIELGLLVPPKRKSSGRKKQKRGNR